MIFPPAEGWFAIDSIDLTGVRSMNIISGRQAPPTTSFSFEGRLDKADGILLGKGSLPPPPKGQPFGIINVPVTAIADNNFHSLYFVYKGGGPISGGVISVQFNAR